MTTKIAFLAGASDTTPSTSKFDWVVSIGANTNADTFIQSNFFEVCSQQPFGLAFSHIIIDLVNISLAVFAADKLIHRGSAYDGWTRDFALNIPVYEFEQWSIGKSPLDSALSFLTGDKWDITFRKREKTKLQQIKMLPYDKVCLLSGGLDSFIGAIDILSSASNNRAIFFSKYGNGGDESNPQKRVISFLKSNFRENLFTHIWSYAQPFGPEKGYLMEESTRSRSFLFLAHGIALATILENGNDLIYPENGLISLNVPLTASRNGSCSTRTTHPYFISQIRDILRIIGINVSLSNPYQFKTKGEMIIDSPNRDIIRNNAHLSCSCSHPNASRYLSHAPGIHCGYCFPCLIRRASLHAAECSNAEPYSIDVRVAPPLATISKGRDYRAVCIGVQRERQNRISNIFRVLASGPLPPADIDNYAGVFQRGMNELSNFLGLN